MGFRALFKIDSIDTNQRHVGYARTEQGVLDPSKPLVETSATVRLSAVEPSNVQDSTHLNSEVWSGRISGNLVLSNVRKEIADTLENGHEYYLYISRAPVPDSPVGE